MPNFYEILGVPKTATKREIQKAYRRLAIKHHPDKEGGDAELFKKIGEAYATLSDDEKRRAYDAGGRSFGNRYNSGGFSDFGGFRGSVRGAEFTFKAAEDVFKDFFSNEDPFGEPFGGFKRMGFGGGSSGRGGGNGNSFRSFFGNMDMNVGGGFDGFPTMGMGMGLMDDPFGGEGVSSSFSSSSSSFTGGGSGGTRRSVTTRSVTAPDGTRRTVKTTTIIKPDGTRETKTEELKDNARLGGTRYKQIDY
eukprot:g4933.t1